MKTLNGCFILLGAFVLLAIPRVKACGRGSMYINNNEYHNMVIAIAEAVDEDETLITRIKEVFTQASEFLYRATRYYVCYSTIL